MVSQEWQEGHDYGFAGHPNFNNPYTEEFNGGDRLKPYDWYAGWVVGNTAFNLAPFGGIPTAPVQP
jgi:hypothetical protein